MTETTEHYDVIVAGGGTAGVIAALQAARAGAKTAILEKDGILGGTVTRGGVNFPGIFHAWGKQVVAGIGWELIEKTMALSEYDMPNFSYDHKNVHWRYQIRINGQAYACIAEEECLKAGVALLYDRTLTGVTDTNDGWELSIVAKGMPAHTLTCIELIDCTGDADAVAMAGYGRERENSIQPGTLMFKLTGYDPQALDMDAVNAEFRKNLADGRMQHGDFSYSDDRCDGLVLGFGANQMHVHGADSSTAETQTETNIRGRQGLLRILRFIRSLPGCGNAVIERMCEETAVRETYRITGEHRITKDEYVSGASYHDAIGHAFYPVDQHEPTGVTKEYLAEGVVPSIPFRSLVPKGASRLLVAGRCIASDRLANSALRVQASCMVMGQAAGVAAALGVKKGVASREVAVGKIRELLKKHGAVLPT